MGLAEKRAVAAFKDTQYPAVKSAIDAAAGFPVEMDVKWDTILSDGNSDSYGEWIPKVYFTPLVDALKAVAVDAMGKEALKGALKKIVIDGSEGSSDSGFSFDSGVLTIKHKVDTNVDYGDERKKGIQKLLEAKL